MVSAWPKMDQVLKETLETLAGWKKLSLVEEALLLMDTGKQIRKNVYDAIARNIIKGFGELGNILRNIP